VIVQTNTSAHQDKALLVCLMSGSMTEETGNYHLAELEGLCETMGVMAQQKLLVRLREPQPKFLLGTGKVDELVQIARDADLDFIIFDDSLSPSQQRNWEAIASCAVIDRQEVILEIFAQRAKTREAVLQVGLARMIYSLPRLTRRFVNLSQQRGGVKGAKGSGETQLELDRRVVLDKIVVLKDELKKIREQRALTRKKRVGSSLLQGAIVGYTNSGKSSLLNALSDAGVLAEDKLFATLDPTTRKVSLGPGRELLVTDTVGFIQKLPHQLVEAFQATLEESLYADFLIHLADGNHPQVSAQIETSLEVLKELGAQDKPMILVLNKCDLWKEDPLKQRMLENLYPDAVFISVKTGEGLETLARRFEAEIDLLSPRIWFEFPLTRGDLAALLHREAQVLSEEYTDTGIRMEASVTEALKAKLLDYMVD